MGVPAAEAGGEERERKASKIFPEGKGKGLLFNRAPSESGPFSLEGGAALHCMVPLSNFSCVAAGTGYRRRQAPLPGLRRVLPIRPTSEKLELWFPLLQFKKLRPNHHHRGPPAASLHLSIFDISLISPLLLLHSIISRFITTPPHQPPC